MQDNKIEHFGALLSAAKEAYQRAYAPYSQFHVGASVLTMDGDIVSGCNVENASYGLTVCAERNCIGHAVVQGKQKLKFIMIYTEEEKLTPPCGACRQVIAEFFAQSALVVAVNHKQQKKIWTVAELLPDAFTPQDLLKD